MPVDSNLVIKGGSGAGVTILTLDDKGIKDEISGGFFSSHYRFTVPALAASVDGFIWTCEGGTWQLTSVAEAHTVVGGASCAAQVVVCPGSGTIASGVAQLSSALDFTVTAPAKSFGILIASPTQIFRGDSLALDYSGTMTGLVGAISFTLRRIG